MERRIPTVASEQDGDEPKGTISFSVRLTEKERGLLEDAANKRGWSLTKLLKKAALEKATHILNTSAPNRVDFRGTAEEIARQLFAPRSVQRISPQMGDDPIPCDLYPSVEAAIAEMMLAATYHDAVAVSPWYPPPEFLVQIRDAVRYGGTEFLDLIIQASEAITSRNEGNLPDPIDPGSI